MRLNVTFSEFVEVPIDQVVPDPEQPRHDFGPEAVQGLTENIQLHGQLVPILVIKCDGHLQIVEGERRWRAMSAGGFKKIRVIVLDQLPTAEQLLLYQLLANCQRQELNPIELSESYSRLLKGGLTATELATLLSKSKSHVSSVLSLQKLTPRVKSLVSAGKISAANAAHLARLSESEQEATAIGVAEGQVKRNQLERITARKARKDDAGLKRVSFALPGTTTSFVSHDKLTLDHILDHLESLAKECKKARSQGLDVSTLVAVLRDRSNMQSFGG